MRTTLNLDDDAMEILKEYSKERDLPLGKAASDLVRRGSVAPVETRVVNGFHAVVLPKKGPAVTNDHVKRLLEDEI